MLLSSYLDFLYEKVRKLTLQKILIILAIFFVIVIFTNGISHYPPKIYKRLSNNPFVSRIDIDKVNYWQESVLLPVIAYYTNLDSSPSFYILCFSIIVLAYLLFAGLTYQREGPAATLIFTAILITSPLTTVMLAWLGTPDSLTVAMTVPFLFINSGILIFLLSILGTMNHIVFTIAAGEILTLRWIARDRIKINHLIAIILGWIMGYVLVKVFFALNNIQVITRFDFILSKNLNFWINMNSVNFPMTISSLFNIQWLIIIVCLIMFFKMDKFYYFSVIAILLFNYGVTFFTEDTTRIYSLLSWGVLLECVFHSYKLALNNNDKETSYQKQFLQALIIIGFSSLIAARYYSWDGEIHPTPFYTFLKLVIK